MSGKRRLGRNRANLLLAVVFLLAANISEAKYSGGTGEPNNPYRIATPNDLNDMGNHPNDWDKHFMLNADINMEGYTYLTALIAPDTNASWFPWPPFQGTPFVGTFDGNAHIISNLTIDTAGADNDDFLGLFGLIAGNGEVRNLHIEDVGITASGANYSYYLGGLCGWNEGTITNCTTNGSVAGGDRSSGLGGIYGINWGQILNCYATASVAGGAYSMSLGGLCGGNETSGTIRNCCATGGVRGNTRLGGLCGSNGGGGTISNSYATSAVRANAGDDNYAAGGLCGYSHGGYFRKCYATGSVSGYGSVGGLFGRLKGRPSVNDCYATGSVTAHERVGGLVGANDESIVSHCYATGPVDGNVNTGGLVGEHSGDLDSLRYTNCFWNTNLNPDVNGIGNAEHPGVIGKTTGEMQTETTYIDAGWDFVDEGASGTWRLCVDGTYPILQWQSIPGDLLCPDGVIFTDYSFFANYWGDENCGLSDDCDGADLDFSYAVEGKDLKIFCQHWLEGAGL